MHITIKTNRKDEVIDITDQVNAKLKEKEMTNGLCTISVLHTTCSVTTADLDPGTDQDMLSFLRAIQPELVYNHPHDPSHAPDHILSSLIGSSVTLPLRDGKLALGTWQRVILVELDGPRQRDVVCTVVKSYE